MIEAGCAFIGLGAIGTPMARQMASKVRSLTVWTRTSAKAMAFAAGTGARSAESPADAARSAEFVVTCLPSSVEVEQVAESTDGLVASMSEGSLLIDCTSGDPATSRRLAAKLQERGVGFVDAPVSGGVKGAEAGALTVMCGGSPGDVERARPILETFAAKIVHCGPVGAGHTVKAMNQLLLAVHIWTTGEALAACALAGVDPAAALDVINASSGRSNTSQNLCPERVLSGAYPRTFRIALLDKDVGIAAAIAEEAGVDSELIDATARLFRLAHEQLGEEADHVEAVRLIERAAGVSLASAR